MADKKKFTRKQVAAQASKDNPIFIVYNDVINMGKFLEDHPGGTDSIDNVIGTDATEAFEDVNHSISAIEMKPQYIIGELVDEDKKDYKKIQKKSGVVKNKLSNNSDLTSSWKVPAVASLALLVLYQYLFA